MYAWWSSLHMCLSQWCDDLFSLNIACSQFYSISLRCDTLHYDNIHIMASCPSADNDLVRIGFYFIPWTRFFHHFFRLFFIYLISKYFIFFPTFCCWDCCLRNFLSLLVLSSAMCTVFFSSTCYCLFIYFWKTFFLVEMHASICDCMVRIRDILCIFLYQKNQYTPKFWYRKRNTYTLRTNINSCSFTHCFEPTKIQLGIFFG